ncbi:calcium/sodium antiporter [Candidatus Woesearchaeota archaeon]|nr:calcium/sodium antiporter [Candidatus Woesearchaeota archaeon]
MAIAEILLFALGLVLLVKGSGFFVKAAASIAKRLGVSEFVIGLTLVAVGTSIPELAASIAASVKHESGLIMGNIVGSNIANIGLILGLVASFSVLKVRKEMLDRDGYIMLFAALLFFFFIINKSISRLEALIFLLFYLAYILFLFSIKAKDRGKYHFREFINYFLKLEYLSRIKYEMASSLKNAKKTSFRKRKKLMELFKAAILKDFLVLIISLAAIILGAKYLVEEAIFFADILSISSTFIGISLIAVGTSLPELSVSMAAAKKGYGNIAIGNIVGSNIANIFLIIGISGLISPLSVTKLTISYTAPFMIFISILLLVLMQRNWKLSRVEGIALLALYALFMASLFFLNFAI